MNLKKALYKGAGALLTVATLVTSGCVAKHEPNAPIETLASEGEMPEATPTFSITPEVTSTPMQTSESTPEPTPTITPEYKVRFTSIEDLYDDKKVDQVAEELLKSIQNATFIENKNIDAPTLAEIIRVYYSVPTKDKKNLNQDYYSLAIGFLFDMRQEEFGEVYAVKKGIEQYIENPNFIEWYLITIVGSPEEAYAKETAEYLKDFYYNGAKAFSNTQKLYNTVYNMYTEECDGLYATIPYAGARYLTWYGQYKLSVMISDLDHTGPFPNGNSLEDFMLPIIYYDTEFQNQTFLDSWAECQTIMKLKMNK